MSSNSFYKSSITLSNVCNMNLISTIRVKKNYFSNLFSIKSECKSINYMQNNEDPFWS